MQLRLALSAIAAAAAIAAAGCGGDDEPSAGAATSPEIVAETAGGAARETDIFTLPEVRTALGDAGLDLVETGLGSGLNEAISEPALSEKRYEIKPSSREFELYVFGSEDAARSAIDDFRDTEFVSEGGGLARARNVVAAFPDQPSAFRGYRVVERVLARLSNPVSTGDDVDAREVRLSDLLASPEKVAGERVSVTGKVAETLRGGASDFVLILGGKAKGERLIVVPDDAQAVAATLDKGDTARVVGTVEKVRTGSADPAPDIVGDASVLERFEGEPALSARMVDEVEG